MTLSYTEQMALFRSQDPGYGKPYVPPTPAPPSPWEIVRDSAIKAATPVLWVPSAVVNAFRKPGGASAVESFNRTGDSWASLVGTGKTKPFVPGSRPQGWGDLPRSYAQTAHDGLTGAGDATRPLWEPLRDAARDLKDELEEPARNLGLLIGLVAAAVIASR